MKACLLLYVRAMFVTLMFFSLTVRVFCLLMLVSLMFFRFAVRDLCGDAESLRANEAVCYANRRFPRFDYMIYCDGVSISVMVCDICGNYSVEE